ncbi:MAG: YkgJ family cysteine cluster protein [Thermodesulfobacteriota bacterium]
MEENIFACKQCGYCCQGETTVSLDKADLQRMTEYLGMPEHEVVEKFLCVTDGIVQMKIVDGHCIFFKNGCTIHPGKPWRCSQWPLHPSILADSANFLAISASCPGINASLGYEEFCRIFSAELDKTGNR